MNILITGAGSGLGYESARQAALRGLRVGIVCRTAEKAEQAVRSLREATGNPDIVSFWADLSVQAEVRRVAGDITAAFSHLDVLMNNAGAVFSSFQHSADGIEMTMAVNHFSYFLLTNRLLPLLKKAPSARIVNVSSNSHYMGQIDVESFTREKNYQVLRAYAQSKLANVLFTLELAEQLGDSSVSVFATSPGRVRTDIGIKNQSWPVALGWRFLNLLGARTLEHGARTQVSAAFDPRWAGISGVYLHDEKVRRPSARALDAGLRKLLWAESARLCGLSW